MKYFLTLLAICVFGCAASPKRIAAVVTEYRHNSHADVIVSRLLLTHTLDGKGERPNLKLVSLYTDQVPSNDTSRKWAKKFNVPIYQTVEQTLTRGTGKLAVDGILLVAEHGKYPKNATGNTIFPKRRLFNEVQKVFRKTGQSVPVFVDKHLADNWADAKWLHDTARKLKVPLMAGSSLPVLWRYPPVDVKRGTKLKEIVAVSYHTLDAYGYHALEMVQCLAERRAGGETGVKQVRTLTGEAVWKAMDNRLFDQTLLQDALKNLKRSPITSQPNKPLKELVKDPVLFVIEYFDGLRAYILTLNGAVSEWGVAWKTLSGKKKSTTFWTQEARPYMHFTHLVKGTEKMFQTGKPTWPAERTLMTSALLDALLISKSKKGTVVPTVHLNFKYTTDWNWHQPPPPPPGRP
tara:strand:+ start:355 stop:1572 length:1218 start_codon:yes stop_codon:yes gene_type:complete